MLENNNIYIGIRTLFICIYKDKQKDLLRNITLKSEI